MKTMYHVIIAGGAGSRFWPKSRKESPKQLLKIMGKETMIRLTYNRLNKISDSDHILINSKSRLQEFLLSKGEGLPIYELLNSKGPDHLPIFTVKVTTKRNQFSIGEGGSIKIAEQKADENLLEKLNNKL